MTLEEAIAKKENAVKLLEAHEDEYRLFYVKVANVRFKEDNGLTPSDYERKLEELRIEREFLRMKADAIHTEIKFLDEIIDLRNDIHTVLYEEDK